jgi:hypothetical protein
MLSASQLEIIPQDQWNKRINMIRHVRSLTKLLGKLDIKRCYHDNQGYIDFYKQHHPVPEDWSRNLPTRYTYGWGLKESKDAIEAYLYRRAIAALDAK